MQTFVMGNFRGLEFGEKGHILSMTYITCFVTSCTIKSCLSVKFTCFKRG